MEREQRDPRYPRLNFKDLGNDYHFWTKPPNNGKWKGTCTIVRHPQNPNNTETWDIDFTADFQSGDIKGTALLGSRGNGGDITIDAKFSTDEDNGGNLFGTVTINTPTPVVCDITCGALLEKGVFGYFDSLDRSGNGNKDSDGNSYTGGFVAYPPDQ